MLDVKPGAPAEGAKAGVSKGSLAAGLLEMSHDQEKEAARTEGRQKKDEAPRAFGPAGASLVKPSRIDSRGNLCSVEEFRLMTRPICVVCVFHAPTRERCVLRRQACFSHNKYSAPNERLRA